MSSQSTKVGANQTTKVDAFTQALDRFRDGLSPEDIAEFKYSKGEDVWNMVERVQKEQSLRGCMQNLARIKPFIDGLTRYAAVIEVFVQAKPEIMALVWVKIPCYSSLSATMLTLHRDH